MRKLEVVHKEVGVWELIIMNEWISNVCIELLWQLKMESSAIASDDDPTISHCSIEFAFLWRTFLELVGSTSDRNGEGGQLQISCSCYSTHFPDHSVTFSSNCQPPSYIALHVRYRPQRWLITNGSFDQWWGTTENPFYHFQGLPFQNPSHCYLWSFFNSDCEKHLLLTMVEVNRPNIMHTQEKRCYIQENIASFTWHRQKSKNMRENGLTCFNQT